MSGTKIYKVWKKIKYRCLNPNSREYKYYGARGITIAEEWKEDFQAFYNYVSQLPHFGEEGYSLDRINNDGNYEPGNLRYATPKEQARNTRKNVMVEYEGQTMTLAEAAEKSKIGRNTLITRRNRGDRGDRLFRPVRKFKSQCGGS